MSSQNLNELILAWGAARGAKYTSPDLAPLTVQIIRQLGGGRPVSAEALAVMSHRSVADIRAQLKQLAAEGIEFDAYGNVVGSALSLNPTRHRLHVDGQVRYAWCALDTFFLPAYLQRAAQVESVCPVNGATIRLTITPEGVAALALQGQADIPGLIAAFAGDHRYILDYLTDEVVAQKPARIQTFLMQTAILDRLSGSLCDAMTCRTDSQALLEQLECANLFLMPLDGARRWYRYHHRRSENGPVRRQSLSLAYESTAAPACGIRS